MKNVLIAINAVLLIAVGVLYYLYFSKNNKPSVSVKSSSAATPKTGECSIAYFELDSLTSSLSIIKDVNAELSKEEDKINGELRRLQKMYNDKISEYQKQAQSMSQIESERANKDILQLQETIRGKQQEMDQKYQDLQMRKKQEIKTKIEDYLKEYNKTRGYSYILAYEPGIIFYRDTMYNITGDLVKGLNDQYKKK